ncbi:MAG: ABC transporter ATP-binding protein, partial [Devosia sp.]
MVALEVGDSVAPVLEIRNLEKRFGNVEVLKSINLTMTAGDFLVLVGPSGCGKSTLLNCIAGLDETSGGKIIIGGRDVTQIPPRDRDIAMVFQSYALYPTMTVAQNIAFGMKVR